MKPILNSRQEAILLSLKKHGFLNREQLQRIHKLGKKRNANRVLSSLSEYLTSYNTDQSAIYYLNALGREYVNTDKVLKKNQFVNHVIIRNYFYIFAGMPTEWMNEVKISDGKVTVIADAFFKSQGMPYFVEIDNTQKMKANREKIEAYKALQANGIIKEHIGHFPMLIWVTTTDLRVKQLMSLCEGLPARIYKIDDIRGA